MTDDQVRRAADAAMVPIVASLAPAGVLAAHWLPDRSGDPVVWLLVGTEIARVQLQSNSWVLPQVQAVLTRLSLPAEKVMAVRLEVTSVEAEDRLFDP